MVVDSSAWISVLIQEPDSAFFAGQLSEAEVLRTCAATWLETAMVVYGKRGEVGVNAFRELLSSLNVEVLPFTEEHSVPALQGFLLFGKGRHAAALNFGDCYCHGFAKLLAEPLLCKGNDFVQTDLTCIVPPPA